MNKTYDEMLSVREKDIFPDKKVADEIINKVHPKSTKELAFKLSNVTSGFYGLTLKQVGMICGWDQVAEVSDSLFRELGELKTIEAQKMGVNIPKDTRALAIIIITAIYTSSPEYNFEVIKFTPEKTEMRLLGACRYYRIAKKLDIDKYLSWPSIAPFFAGIADYLGIDCSIDMRVNSLEDDGTCDYYLLVEMK